MKFKWPKKLTIGVRTQIIRYVSRAQMIRREPDNEVRQTSMGGCDFRTGEIELCTERPEPWRDQINSMDASPDEIFMTLLHECLHSTFRAYSIEDDNEVLIDVIATELTKVVRACVGEIPPVYPKPLAVGQPKKRKGKK